MNDLAHRHTIHKDHIHHGWNNAFAPCLRIAPGESVEFETLDASSGQLTRTSTAADLEKLDLARVNPVTGPVYIDGAQPGDALKVTVLSLRPSGWGWTGNIPGFGLLADQFPNARLHHWNYDPGLAPAMYGPGGRVPLRPFTGTIGVAPAEPGLHSIIPPRNVGGNMDARDIAEGHGALPADRGRRRDLLGRRHPRGAGRRRGVRHRDRKPDRRGAQVRTRQGCAPAFAALCHAGPGLAALRRQGLRSDDRHRAGPDGRRARGGVGHGRAPRAGATATSRSTPTCCAACARTCASARSSTCRTGSCPSTSLAWCWSSVLLDDLADRARREQPHGGAAREAGHGPGRGAGLAVRGAANDDRSRGAARPSNCRGGIPTPATCEETCRRAASRRRSRLSKSPSLPRRAWPTRPAPGSRRSTSRSGYSKVPSSSRSGTRSTGSTPATAWPWCWTVP